MLYVASNLSLSALTELRPSNPVQITCMEAPEEVVISVLENEPEIKNSIQNPGAAHLAKKVFGALVPSEKSMLSLSSGDTCLVLQFDPKKMPEGLMAAEHAEEMYRAGEIKLILAVIG